MNTSDQRQKYEEARSAVLRKWSTPEGRDLIREGARSSTI